MSDAVRSFSQRGTGGATGGGSAPRGGYLFTRFVVVAFMIFAISSFWISRDTHRIQQFVEREPASLIVAQNILQNRDEIFGSSSWNALPDSAQSHPVPAVLATPFSVPDWMSRNLIGRYLLITTQHSTDFNQAIYITRMSRVGVLLERVLRRRSWNQVDDSGGLNLRYLSNSDLYYTVRGRVLIASPSRRALIHTLTLSDTEHTVEEIWDDSISILGDDDFRGTFRLPKDSRWESYIPRISFVLNVRDGDSTLEMKAVCTKELYEEFIPQLEGEKLPKLIRPMPGAIEFSANLGTTFQDLSQLLEGIIAPDLESDEPWLVGFLQETDPQRASYVDPFINAGGPRVAQTWHGYALDDVVPGHTISKIADYGGTGIQDALAAASQTLRDGAFEDLYVSREPQINWLEIETIGGPALTTVLGQGTGSAGDEYLFMSTSKQMAGHLGWADRRVAQTLKEPGNLYVRIEPGTVLTEYEAYSAALQNMGRLSESEWSERDSRTIIWRERMKGIRDIELVVQHENREISATLLLRHAF